MKDNLTVSIIQSNLHWENKEANIQLFSEKINKLSAATDLILLPEMFSTGFTMNPSAFAETMEGPAVRWMQTMAKERNAVIAGSLVVTERNQFFNRLVWMKPDGSYETYDKRHLFRHGNEHVHYTPGKSRLIAEIHGWKICPLICYDLRFPVWARNSWVETDGVLKGAYDVLIYVANWPERRNHPWKTLLPARAIENSAYTIGVNRVGEDGTTMYHSGDSAVYDFKGEKLSANSEPGVEFEETIQLSAQELLAYRAAFPSGLDADAFELK